MNPTRGASSARSVSYLTAGVLLIIATYGLLSNYQSAVLNSVVESFHLTGGAQGIMSALINLGAVAAFLVAPMLQGRVKKTTIILVAACILVVSFFLLGTVRALAGLIVSSILVGIGFGWLDASCNALMVDLHHDDSAKYLGLQHGGFGIGGLVAPLLIGALLAVVSWHTVSMLMGVLIALAGIVFFILLTTAKKGVPVAAKEQPLTRAGTRAFLFQKRNVLLLIATMMYAASQAGFLVWIVRYMTLQYNAEQMGSIALSLYWVFGTLSRFFAPRLKIHPLVLFLLGVTLAFVFQTIGVLSGSAVVMCIMGALIGLVSGHCVPMMISVASADNPGQSALIASSFLVSIYSTNVFSPLFMGALASWTNLNVMMLAPSVYAALAGVFALFLLLDERRAAAKQLA